ncbi:probable peptidyl-prolyl cis-trans isomerase [Rhodopirellula baltica SH 1]|uniref:Periplasmic chaperone PpiD n=1 Tax=Rhodopirellula baltica (strain DSM 10527 / NCIMB 13988 / SH1) TaxID=243090 RepID=Q7UPZ6_RHOBA|nr:probable peptidyl-prolyl cis-trans isomerase [Rhodopirellula baltica SH 1]
MRIGVTMPSPCHHVVPRCFAWIALAIGVTAMAMPRLHAQMPTRAEVEEAKKTPLPTDPATVMAVVGQGRVLLGELKPRVDAQLSRMLAQASGEVPEDELHYVKLRMTRSLLVQTIQSRMLREAFLLEQVGTAAADKRREAEATMAAKARQMFYETELPGLMKKANVDSKAELDDLLRKEGSSLAFRQREFMDQMLGSLYIRSKVNKDPAVSLSEIVRYYQEHQSKYEHKARARWEQLTVMFSNHPTRDAAMKAITEMGREALYGGNMQAVAKAKSEEPFASSGGLHDWTNQGSLVSAILDQQIFSLPTGKMSEIIEDTDAYHIIRVLEREDAGVTPVGELQDDISDILRQQKIRADQEEVMVEVRQRVPVWSFYPDDFPEAKPLLQVSARPALQR